MGQSARSRWLTRRRLLVVGIQVLVLGISVLAIALLVGKVQWAKALHDAGHVSWRLVAFAIVLNIPTTLLRALRSQLLVQRLGHRVPFLRMNGVDLAGQTLSWLTPAATGDLSRPYLWRTHDRLPVSAGVAVVVYERLATLLQLALVGGVFAAALYLPPAAVAGLAVAAAALLIAPWWVCLITSRFAVHGAGEGRRGLIGGILRSLDQLEHLGLSLRLTGLFALCTVLVFVISGFQLLVLAWGVGVSVGLGVVIAAYCLSQVAGSLSTLPFGVVASDAVTTALLVAGGVAKVDAVVVTLLVRLALTLPLGIAGAIGILVLGRPQLPAQAAAGASRMPDDRPSGQPSTDGAMPGSERRALGGEPAAERHG